MPSSSKKQHNFMEAIAHSPSFAKKVGVSQSIGRDFSAADKGRKFAKGGDMATKGMNLFKGKESYGEEMKEAKAIKSGKISPMQYAKGEKSEKKMKKMSSGGFTREADGIAQRGKTQGAQPKMFASGGFVRSADGCAQRGKTKAKQVKMAGGGSC